MPDIAQLMLRGESDSLDFKGAQYPLETEAAKAEFIKDVLAMANSWRREPGYILLGVAESDSGPNIVGVKKHHDDAMLQQIVNGKTQRPVTFSYSSVEVDGKSVGVISVPVQTRPLHLKQDFLGLKANTVYLRRGSSTMIASLDEVAKMGAAAQQLVAGDLLVQFGDQATRKTVGDVFAFASTLVTVDKEIGDFHPRESYMSLDNPNREFYRDFFDVVYETNLLRPTALTATNTGALPADNVRIEFILLDPTRLWEFSTRRRTRFPKRYHRLGDLGDFDPVFVAKGPRCNFEYLADSWYLTFELEDLQPGRTLWPAVEFFVGATRAGVARLQGKIMADGLATACTCELRFDAQAKEYATTLKELLDRFER